MFRRTPKDLLKDNLFLVITVFFAAVITVGIYYCVHLLSAGISGKPRTKIIKLAKAGEEKFVITCFNDSAGIRCKSPKGGHCSVEFKKDLQKICSDMEALGISTLDKIAVDIRKYGTCDEKIEQETGCMAYFVRENDDNGYGKCLIDLPAPLFKDKGALRAVLIHEIAHALTSKHHQTMARIVKEFFAVYAQVQFYGNKLQGTCNGAEPALRNYSGNYFFPPLKKYRAMNIFSACRYGQLEYIIRELQKESPFLFEALWRELGKNEGGKFDTAWLKSAIAKIDNKAGKIVSRFYIFNEADASPQIAIMGNKSEHCVFIYRNMSARREHYSAEDGFQMEWRRGGKHMAWLAVSYAPMLCYPADKFASGDVLHIRAVGMGKSFYRIFIVP